MHVFVYGLYAKKVKFSLVMFFSLALVQSKDDEYLEQLIDQQRLDSAARRQQILEEESRERTLKRKHKDALIDDLVIYIQSPSLFSPFRSSNEFLGSSGVNWMEQILLSTEHSNKSTRMPLLMTW